MKSLFAKQHIKIWDLVIKNKSQTFIEWVFTRRESQKWMSSLHQHDSRMLDIREQIFWVMTFHCIDPQSPHTISIHLSSHHHLDHTWISSTFLDSVSIFLPLGNQILWTGHFHQGGMSQRFQSLPPHTCYPYMITVSYKPTSRHGIVIVPRPLRSWARQWLKVSSIEDKTHEFWKKDLLN